MSEVRKAFLQAQDKQEIEVLAQALSVTQFFELLDACASMTEKNQSNVINLTNQLGGHK